MELKALCFRVVRPSVRASVLGKKHFRPTFPPLPVFVYFFSFCFFAVDTAGFRQLWSTRKTSHPIVSYSSRGNLVPAPTHYITRILYTYIPLRECLSVRPVCCAAQIHAGAAAGSSSSVNRVKKRETERDADCWMRNAAAAATTDLVIAQPGV